MVMQVQTSSLSKKLAGRLATAHAAHKDAPPEVGNAQLPEGIENGVAQLVECKIGEYKDGENKGQLFFRAAGTVIEPKTLRTADGRSVNVAGRQTSVMVPLCDTPKSKGKKKTFEDHYADFLNHLKLLGVDMSQTKTGTPEQVESYLMSAMQLLKKSKPFFGFRTWKGKATPEFPNPRTTEEWNGVCEYDPNINPETNGMTNAHAAANGALEMQPDSFTEPPMGQVEDPNANTGDDTGLDIDALVALADADPNPETATDEGKDAMNLLKETAVSLGIDEGTVDGANSWAEVGTMIVEAQGGDGIEAAAEEPPADPVKGGIYDYRKRDGAGNPLLGKDKKTPLAAVKVEVVTVNPKSKTVTVKTADGKSLVGPDKKPINVKWDHLEVV